MAERTLVMKFGGTSVGSPDALRNMAQIVGNTRKDWERAVVVVSAMGGVTDLLLAGTAAAIRGDVDEVRKTVTSIAQKHTDAIREGSLDPKTGNAIEAAILKAFSLESTSW